jgi:exportin-2 (importin alpha re-exporter)
VTPAPIPDPEKAQVRGLITGLMLGAPPVVRAQLAEGLALIGASDFPARWPELLPDLITRLEGGSPPAVHGVLETANAIYKRYRGSFMTPALSSELEYSQALVRPLLAALEGALDRARAAAAVLAAAPGEAEALAAAKLALSTARLAVRVFYSLNSPGLTEDFEAALPGWMAALHAALTLPAPPGTAPADPDAEAPTDALRRAVADAATLFMEVNEDEFAPFLPSFARDVWALLVGLPATPGADGLAMAATRFLTTVAKSVHAGLFSAEGALAQVCGAVVLPALRLRPEAEELFEMNYVEYIRRDAEGGDADTRRRAATELVRALAARFPEAVTAELSRLVGGLLAGSAGGGEDGWRAKDCAVYLVSALAARARTAAGGVAGTTDLVDVPDFFGRHVAPELAARAAALRAGGGGGQPPPSLLPGATPCPPGSLGPDVLAADALRFATLFRATLPTPALLALLPHAVACLAAPSNVLHSYAALFIDRLLACRVPGPTADNGGGAGATSTTSAPRVPPSDLAPLLPSLLDGLFGALDHPDSGENEYCLRAVVRVLSAAGGPAIAPYAPTVLARLSGLLARAAANPGHPGFAHALFEGVACLVAQAAPAGEPALAALEAGLFPPFTAILQNDVADLHPYTFQVLAQLVEARPAVPGAGAPGGPPSPLPPAYASLLPPLLAPAFWERPANVPALARFLRALLLRAGGSVVAAGQLEAVLGVLQKLVSTKAADGESMRVAVALLRGAPRGSLAPYGPTLWSLLLRRLQAARTPRYAAGLILFCAATAALEGGAALAAAVDGVQPGLFAGALVRQVWAPGLAPAAVGAPLADRKLLAVGTAAALVDVPALADDPGTWGSLLGDAVGIAAGAAAGVGGPHHPRHLHDDDDDGSGEIAAAAAAAAAGGYAVLRHAAPPPDGTPADDALPAVPSPGAGLAAELARGCAARPGVFPALIAAHVPADPQARLRDMCAAAGATLA